MAAKIERILVPIDLSDNSLQAKTYADLLADQYHAEIELLHVVDKLPYEVYLQKGLLGGVTLTANGEVPSRQTSETTRQKLLSGVTNHLGHLAGKGYQPCITMVRDGYAVEEILQEIERYKPDLVVICTRGWTGLRHLALGSVAEKVVRLSPVAVLTVRATNQD